MSARRFTITGAMAPAHEHSERVYIPLAQGQLLCADSAVWAPLPAGVWRFSGLEPAAEPLYLGQFQGQLCFVVACLAALPVPGYHWESLRGFMRYLDEEMFELASRAMQIVSWDHDHRFCGRCGQPTQAHGQDRARSCLPCKLDYYPRLSPCVITLVTRADYCLLGNNAQFPSAMYSALAGFIEPGETVESCLRREVAEEVGVEVGKVHYFSSQPWPFPGQLMLGFHADYSAGDIVVDGVEIAHADWFRYDQLPQVPPETTLSGRLIADFVRRWQR